jgi:putative flippase GtrA
VQFIARSSVSLPPVVPAPAGATSRWRSLARELVTFGIVGLAGLVVDVGVFNALRYAGEPGLLADKPLTAKVLSVVAATMVTYLGNRHLTWRDRPWGDRRREYVIFFALNGVGMSLAVACLGVSHYLLGLTSPLADNLSANVVGLVLGTAFRFWAYRRFVFPRVSAGSSRGRSGTRLPAQPGPVSRDSSSGAAR